MKRTAIDGVALDYSGTLTSEHDPIDPALDMRPVSAQAATTVRHLAQSGLTLALVSNTRPGQDRRPALKAAGIADAFADRIFLSHELGIAKPDPRVWRHVLDHLAVAPERLVYCGNNLTHDIHPAVALGIRTVLLSRTEPRALPPGATWIAAITDLPGLLAQPTRQEASTR